MRRLVPSSNPSPRQVLREKREPPLQLCTNLGRRRNLQTLQRDCVGIYLPTFASSRGRENNAVGRPEWGVKWSGLPPPSFSSSSSSPIERRSFSPDLPDNITVTHTFSHYSGFKYRLWFIWFIWYTWNHWSERWESPPWLDIIGQYGVPGTPLGRNSPVFYMLYELVVPPWPLLLWVAYRTAANNRSERLTTFVEMIRGPGPDDQDLITWGEKDDSCLSRILSRAEDRGGLYPWDWSEYMNRPCIRSDYNYDLKTRATAVLLQYSSIPIAGKNILATLGINDTAFDTMARAIDGDYQNRLTVANFDSEEFWAGESLKNWLSTCDETLCHGLWHTPIPLLERVRLMDHVLNILPCNLATYTYSLMRQPASYGFSGTDAIRQLGGFSLGDLKALQNYPQDVQILIDAVKKLIEENPSIATNQTISTHVHENIKRDVPILVARLVLYLNDPVSYKELLSSCGRDAQQLLDLLQDLLDLNSFSVVKPFLFKALLRLSRSSGLHPRCLALSGLKTVGQQVTGGGFGDIWKGFVRGQSVCVKIMRVFEDSNVEAVLKYIQEFGREAVIWRQFCHPNLLPFFGIYYLDSRLCLVSPWMEYGNVIKFLTAEKPTNAERLSLILDVAIGLQYLHAQKIVHGDLKGLNILVTPSRRACIADFGLSTIAETMTLRFTHSTVTARGGTARYQAPELFEDEDPARIHYGSDVYTFSCVSYEILSGMAPFYELRNDMDVMMRVGQGYCPPRPELCSGTAIDGLWELMEQCWEQSPQMRPTAFEIVKRLGGPSIGAQTVSSTSDWRRTSAAIRDPD
ncbi:kinase-like domain-containing protein [Mycena olivaceomarginata]|nr:kinase-like domain-containing protein [Mycena olivaceomarginata]